VFGAKEIVVVGQHEILVGAGELRNPSVRGPFLEYVVDVNRFVALAAKEFGDARTGVFVDENPVPHSRPVSLVPKLSQ
jgi:N-formylglutamate amidohydrolase